jgi:glycosyltransferase involved in cell wall biosynthesis
MNCARNSKIVLLTGNSLCHNPRALKEASALARAGHRVCVLGAWLDPAFKARDLRLIETVPFEFISVLDFTFPGMGNEMTRFVRRAGKKMAHLVHSLTRRQSPLQLGFGIGRLFRQALSIDADLYIAHSEVALYAGRELLRRGRCVGVDMEDWFSEDLLPQARRQRPLRLLNALEREVLLRGAWASCPSQAMSAELAQEYGCPPPAVIYNAFALSERQTLDGETRDRRSRDISSLHWYSATLGPGRGLEDLIAAIPFLKHETEIHLRGNPSQGFEDWLKSRIPHHWRHNVFFHPLVNNEELLSRIAEHDIGFAGEMKYCRSRDLTVTNKILQYLLGGLAVVASDTAGQREVAEQAPDAVQLYPSGNGQALADVLNALLGSPERIRHAKAAALAAAQKSFCWEKQEKVLLDGVRRALARPIATGKRDSERGKRQLAPMEP